ncbi:MAG: GrpB family protein [Candidatus Binataceae bacterium]
MQPERFLIYTYSPAETRARFDTVCRRVQTILPVSADIEHVGATAIPGCLSKGDVDLCVRVTQVAFTACDTALERHFQRNTVSERNESFSAFQDQAANTGIQLVVIGSSLDVFTTFRDLLLKNPNLLAEYNQLKKQYHGKSMTEYRQAKGDFIQNALSDV